MLPCCLDKLSYESDPMYDIVNKPHEVFTNDLIFFLCEELEISWTPPCCRIYSIHPCSPLTADVRRIIHFWFGERCHNHFEGNYNEYEPKFAYQLFCRDVTCTLQKLSADIPGAVSIQEMIFHVISIAKLSIQVYERGALDALTFAATCITEALEEYNAKIEGEMLELFSDYACTMVRRFTREATVFDDKVYWPHEVFANDLILHISQKRKAACSTRCCKLSKFSKKSTLTPVTRIVIDRLYRKPESFYNEACSQYEKDLGTQWDAFQRLSDAMTRDFEMMLINATPAENWEKDKKLLNELFNKVINYAQACVSLHRRGTHATLSLGQLKLAEVLRKCNRATHGRLFGLINNFATSVYKILSVRDSTNQLSSMTLRYKDRIS